jgi:hypothetical protein
MKPTATRESRSPSPAVADVLEERDQVRYSLQTLASRLKEQPRPQAGAQPPSS